MATIDMNQKTEQQLNWIIANEGSYSKSMITAANDELRRRGVGSGETDSLENAFTKFWDSLKGYLRLS